MSRYARVAGTLVRAVYIIIKIAIICKVSSTSFIRLECVRVCSARVWCDAMQCNRCAKAHPLIFLAQRKAMREWESKLNVHTNKRCVRKCHEEKQFHLQGKQVIQTINASKSKIKFCRKSLRENFVQKYTHTHTNNPNGNSNIIFRLLASSQWKRTLWLHSNHSMTVVRLFGCVHNLKDVFSQ